MDVTGTISELRAERENIEQAILSLERFDRLSAGTTKESTQSVIQIRRTKENLCQPD